jgi:UTP--glucose-1-phosphate uridylyltransferase
MDRLNPLNFESEPDWRHALAKDPRFDSALLSEFDFDATLCLDQMHAVAKRQITSATALVTDPIEPVRDIPEVSYEKTKAGVEVYRAGADALAQGQVAVLVLNGGLATRFGGVVKGTVQVFDDRSFLGLKITDVVRASELFGAAIPLVIMNSFATRTDTTLHLQANDHFGMHPGEILAFDQSVSIRLDESGDPFIGDDGLARYYAPGHGEFFQRIHKKGVYEQLSARGIRYVTFSNIDNLGASIDPWLIGNHILSGRDMTVEVIPRTRNALGEWDVGGAPVIVQNRAQVIEGFRLPPSLAPDALSDFQTNNMYFSMSALSSPPVLPRYWVSKQLEGRRSVSFEAVTCEATTVLRDNDKPWLSLNLVRVARRGPRGRFFPVKSREDLASVREEIRSRTEQGWELREKDARSI